MNEKTARQIENMKKQTIGVEVECNSITRRKAAEVAAGFFGTGRFENTAYRNGYMTWSAWDQQGREWKFQRDSSINGPDDEKCELVSPILTYEDIESFQGLLRRLRRAGAKSSPSRGCGVHIHIGAQGHTPKTLRNLVNIMAAHESQIGRAIRIDAGRVGTYCRTVDPASWSASTGRSPPPWTTSRTAGTRHRTRNAVGAITTTAAGTTCSTSTRPSPKARLSSDFSSFPTPTTAKRAEFMPER